MVCVHCIIVHEMCKTQIDKVRPVDNESAFTMIVFTHEFVPSHSCPPQDPFPHVHERFLSPARIRVVCTIEHNHLSHPHDGVILVSHDEHLINLACNEVWLCKNHSVYRL